MRPRQPAQVLSHGRRPGAGRRLVTETRRLGLEQPPGPGRPARQPGKAPVRGGAWKQEGGGTGHPRVPGTQETPKPQRCPKTRTQGPQALGCGVEGPGPHCPQTLCLHAKAPDSSLYPLPPGLHGLPVLRRAPESLELQPLRLEGSEPPTAGACGSQELGAAFPSSQLSGLCDQSQAPHP